MAQFANRRLVVIQVGRHLGGLFYERNDVPVFHRLHIDSRKAVEQFVDIPAAFLVPDDEFAVFLADVEFVEALIILGLSLIGMVVEVKEWSSALWIITKSASSATHDERYSATPKVTSGRFLWRFLRMRL